MFFNFCKNCTFLLSSKLVLTKKFSDFLENQLVAEGVNVVIISHAIYDAEEGTYSLVGKGSFSKLGGFLSTVDEAAFIETKNDKRIIHLRSTKFPARTLQAEFPDSVPVKDFSLNQVLEHLTETSAGVSEFAL